MAVKKLNKGAFKEGDEYKKIAVKAYLSPIMYKEFVQSMNAIGIDSESQYLKYCISLGNQLNVSKNGRGLENN